jgi:hypothetical protein
MKPIEGINPRTGEYFHYEPRKSRPPEPQLWLDFEQSFRPQIGLMVSENDIRHLEALRGAYSVLLAGGCLPGNRYRQMQRQINLKAAAAIRRHSKKEND